MCGIAGIHAYHYAAPPVDRDELRRIRDAMQRRGPDGAGEWFSTDGRTALGHRRLSIIDLSERASQPMLSADGRFAISFNGEIYNYKALRARLERSGHVFRSDSDTEVLLHLFAEQGMEMVHELRGMFAFILFDSERGTAYLARDPYGIKPLYYADDGWCVRAASQVKALIAGGSVSRAIEPAAAAGFFLFGSVPEPWSIYAAIRPVPAGSIVTVTPEGASEPRSYHSVARVFAAAATLPAPRSDEEAYDEARRAVLDSVAHHMVADVPVGTFLSAGIDSGSIVGLLRDGGFADVRTITLAFDEYHGRHDDEAPLAEEVARLYGTDHRTRRLAQDEFDADVDDIFDAMDQPSIDGVNTYFVSKAAHERGLKVVLSGLGGDELFGGYNSFDDVPRWARRCALPAAIPGAGRLFRGIYRGLAGRGTTRSPKAAGILEYGGSYPGAYYLRRGLFMPWELERCLGRDLAEQGLERLDLRAALRNAMTPDPSTPFGRVAALEASLYMRNQLLRDSDWAGMAHSLELRVPLVDAKLLSDLAPMLLRHAPRHRKQLLAMAPRVRIPDHIRMRAKTGFQVPVHEWLQSNPSLDGWRRVPELARDGCPWARRWAHVVFSRSCPDLMRH